MTAARAGRAPRGGSVGTTIQLPCKRCGRPVRVAVGSAASTCAVCDPSYTWQVWRGDRVIGMSRAQVALALQKRTLDATDAAEDEHGTRLLLPAHPALRGFFLPSHPDWLGDAVVDPPQEPFWRRWFRGGTRSLTTSPTGSTTTEPPTQPRGRGGS